MTPVTTKKTYSEMSGKERKAALQGKTVIIDIPVRDTGCRLRRHPAYKGPARITDHDFSYSNVFVVVDDLDGKKRELSVMWSQIVGVVED